MKSALHAGERNFSFEAICETPFAPWKGRPLDRSLGEGSLLLVRLMHAIKMDVHVVYFKLLVTLFKSWL
jgi:hypothetical protein